MFILRKKKERPTIQFHDFWEIDRRQVSASFQKLEKRIGQLSPLTIPKPAFNWWKLTTIAASMALFIVYGLTNRIAQPQPVEQPVEIATVTDRATPIVLSDGSKVWISANSQLRYQQTFTGKTRDVILDGEAYFEVAHNKELPFRVFAGGQTVVALGTSFNVRAYSGDTYIKVSLVEGSVSVTNDLSGKAVILKPAQEVTIGKKAGLLSVTDNQSNQTIAVNTVQKDGPDKSVSPIAVKDANIDLLMSWKTGKYVFNNVPFEDIARTLEKGFKVTIHIENEKLKTKPYTMRFENGESLEKILDLIQINAKYSYQYHNGIVVIK